MTVGDKFDQFRPSGPVMGEDLAALTRAKESRDRDWQKIGEVLRNGAIDLVELQNQITALTERVAFIETNIPFASSTFTINAGVVTFNGSRKNIDTITTTGSNLRITFETAAPNANYLVTVIRGGLTDYSMSYGNNLTTRFDIRADDVSTGAQANLSIGIHAISFHVIVLD